MKFFAYNPSVDELEKTYLSRSTAQGATVFSVKNTERFNDGQMILVGEMSRERSEILTLSSHTATSLTTDAADFPHDADDPIYLLQYDRIRIYRSTTGENGVYNLYDNQPIDVDNADGKTWYDDPNSLDTYWYKIAYYNSVDDLESELSPPIQATGYPTNSVGELLIDTSKELGDPSFITMDIAEYISHINSINHDLLTQAKRPYRFLKTNQLLDVEEDGNSVDFPVNFWKLNYLEVREALPVGTRVYRPDKINVTTMRNRQSYTTLPGDTVNEVAYDDEERKILFNPKARTARIGAFDLHYYKTFDKITNMSDLLETPNNLVYKLGLKREFYLKKADDDIKYLRKADLYDKRYNAEVMKLQREKNIDASGPSGMGADRKRYIQFGGPRYRQ